MHDSYLLNFVSFVNITTYSAKLRTYNWVISLKNFIFVFENNSKIPWGYFSARPV